MALNNEFVLLIRVSFTFKLGLNKVESSKFYLFVMTLDKGIMRLDNWSGDVLEIPLWFPHDFIRSLKQCLLSCSLWMDSLQTAETQTLCSNTDRQRENWRKEKRLQRECNAFYRSLSLGCLQISPIFVHSLSLHHKYASAVDNDSRKRSWSFRSHIPLFFPSPPVFIICVSLHILCILKSLFVSLTSYFLICPSLFC